MNNSTTRVGLSKLNLKNPWRLALLQSPVFGFSVTQWSVVDSRGHGFDSQGNEESQSLLYQRVTRKFTVCTTHLTWGWELQGIPNILKHALLIEPLCAQKVSSHSPNQINHLLPSNYTIHINIHLVHCYSSFNYVTPSKHKNLNSWLYVTLIAHLKVSLT